MFYKLYNRNYLVNTCIRTYVAEVDKKRVGWNVHLRDSGKSDGSPQILGLKLACKSQVLVN